MADLLDPETVRKQSLELGMSVDMHEPYAGAFGALMQNYKLAWELTERQRELIAKTQRTLEELIKCTT